MHHGAAVRLTINLEDELYEAARSMALADGVSISTAVNRLLQRAVAPKRRTTTNKRGFPVVKGRRRFTSEDVYKIDQL